MFMGPLAASTPFDGVDGGRAAEGMAETVLPIGVVTRIALGSSPDPHSIR